MRFFRQHNNTDPIRVLSIDGGGIRAMIPALILDHIEQRTGRAAADMFDLVAGTSSGGIVALGMVCPDDDGRPRFTAKQLAGFFKDEGSKIFSATLGSLRQVIDDKYPHAPMERILQEYFGETPLRDALRPVVIPCYDVEKAAPRFFKSRNSDTDGEVPMWKVARATTAAPTFFESFRLDIDGRMEALIDGGMIANNPALCALTEVTHHLENYTMAKELQRDIMIVSLGTGRLRQYYTHDQIKDWGALEWARPAIEITITGGVETVHYQLEEILRASGDQRHYYRFQTDVPDANRAMDDASRANLRVVQRLAEEMLDTYRADLDELVRKLR